MIKIAIDRGGTFTDIYAKYKNKYYVKKVLSEDPDNYSDAPSFGIQKILSLITHDFPNDEISLERIEWIRMGTTVATNALLERKGVNFALIVTKGFKDILEIGYQNRKDLFAIDIEKKSQLYNSVFEIDERIIATSHTFKVEKQLQESEVIKVLSDIKSKGITNIAVSLVHSYGYDNHENKIKKLAEGMGFTNISLSSEIMPSIKYINRTTTVCLDAYITPHVKKYIKTFLSNSNLANDNSLFFMQSNGGLTETSYFRGTNALLSGPAGGVVGYSKSFFKNKPLIGFDMGGTSTDVSRYNGSLELSYDNLIDDILITSPQLDILTVAAGGGSRLFYDHGLMRVGPESAGAHPGPVCYRKQGYLSITDANVVLGRLQPEYFPMIFGPMENEKLDTKSSKKAFEKLTQKINVESGKQYTVEEIALGFINIANENMMKPIKEVSIEKGFDIAEHSLVCFGGAGGQHACAIAKVLGIKEVFVHKLSGILSAFGLGMSEVRHFKHKALYRPIMEIEDQLSVIEDELLNIIINEYKPAKNYSYEFSARLKYEGTDKGLEVKKSSTNSYSESFCAMHKLEFGFIATDKLIIIEELHVELIVQSDKIGREEIPSITQEPVVLDTVMVYFEFGYKPTPVFDLNTLHAGQIIMGPAIILNETSTVIIEPNCIASISKYGDIIIDINNVENRSIDVIKTDPISASIFYNNFMSLAEQMGAMLQRIAVSVNIKERLDYSCALFNNQGYLVANAPHIPVHLGAMGETVRSVLEKYKNNIEKGDVFITNSPYEGGSHLPDITIIVPHIKNGEILFITACRGHHADIGGITPGSMPALSTQINDEGAMIDSFKIVKQNEFMETKLTELFITAGARQVWQNVSDIKAQISACLKGIDIMNSLIDKYSYEMVSYYMNYIQELSSNKVREFLSYYKGKILKAEEYLDNGTNINVKIAISPDGQSAIFDFSKSGEEVMYNQNCPRSVTISAILYVLRILVRGDYPLNEGFLKPIELVIPKGSVLNPSRGKAIAGGNVTTSQRVVDVLLKAFEIAAASNGCMNNVSFGNDTFGYYETIAGGAGATSKKNGAHAVHTHMTNTRITDVELLENSIPIILRNFSIRKDSGGRGIYIGGDGVCREYEFLTSQTVSLLTDRRVYAPYGMNSGKPGKKGKNILIKNGEKIVLKGISQIDVNKGDRLQIFTPGGGGWGKPKHLLT